MKNLVMPTALALAALCTPALVAAQAQPPAGEIVVTAEHQRDWDRGSAMEAEGLRDLARAERDHARYTAAVAEAQNKQDTSRSRADNARATFDNLTSRPAPASPRDARRWAASIESAARDWERFDEQSEEGTRELDRALRRLERANDAVAAAQARIDEGRMMMANAERLSRVQARR